MSEEEFYIGVDLGATNIRAALADSSSRIHRKIRERTIRNCSGEKLVQQICKLIRKIGEEELDKVRAIGVGTIGPLDYRRGVLLNPANLPAGEVPLEESLRKEFMVPVYVLNDCTTAVLGEKKFGLGKSLDNIFYVTLSSGIGGGAIVDGNLLVGKDGNAVEIGHMVVDVDGRMKCGCGGRGHWEAYCSGKNIPSFVKYLVETYPREFSSEKIRRLIEDNTLTSQNLFQLAREGDEYALKLVKEIGRINAIGFANINTIFDPELITVGGAVALHNRELIIEPIVGLIRQYTINRVPAIKITTLGDDIVLYGAIALAMDPPKILTWR
ncbi:MAG: ROK family protein [Nitrososphaerota archaeon]